MPAPLPASVKAFGVGARKNLFVADLVGIVGLQLKDWPKTPRICWDNREHHFWEGFSGGFEPRNTIVNDSTLNELGDGSVEISFYYIVNYIKTKIKWRFSDAPGGVSILWDTMIETENQTGQKINDYMSFFACYHHPGINYYYDGSGEIRKCTDEFYACGNPENRERYRAITKQFMATVKGWHGVENPTESSPIYKKPILLSEPLPCYGGARHIVMVEEEKCIAIVSAMNQARDYMLGPPGRDFAPDESFSARARHLIARVDSANDLESLWSDFRRRPCAWS